MYGEEQQPTPTAPIASSSNSNWSNLVDDLLNQILAHLSSLDIIRLSMVCSSWNRIVRGYYKSSVPAPWLLLPRYKTAECDEDVDGCVFYNVEENKIYKQKNRIYKDFGKRRCIGSSHGWLILLDHERARPFLLNPFSGTRILLPPPETLADVVGYYSDGGGEEGYHVLDRWNSKVRLISIKELRDGGFFFKAVLSSNPYFENKYGAIVIYNDKSKLAFWKHGEGGEFVWKNFNGACQGGYSDVICTADNLVYALSTSVNDHTGFTVEGWDFKQQAPSKLMQVTAPLPRQLILRSMLAASYLVESLGDIWLVVRKIWIPRKRIHFTTEFSVFKMDFQLRQWTDVHNRSDFWSDRLLFLGRNHSLLLSAKDFPKLVNIDNGSVYYTDDIWDFKYNDNPSFVGHDLGLLGKDGHRYRILSQFYALYNCPIAETLKIEPPPIWVALTFN